jgi:hypothetical protein
MTPEVQAKVCERARALGVPLPKPQPAGVARLKRARQPDAPGDDDRPVRRSSR